MAVGDLSGEAMNPWHGRAVGTRLHDVFGDVAGGSVVVDGRQVDAVAEAELNREAELVDRDGTATTMGESDEDVEVEGASSLDLSGSEVLKPEPRLSTKLLDEAVPTGGALAVPVSQVDSALRSARARIAALTASVALLVPLAMLIDLRRSRQGQEQQRRGGVENPTGIGNPTDTPAVRD